MWEITLTTGGYTQVGNIAGWIERHGWDTVATIKRLS